MSSCVYKYMPVQIITGKVWFRVDYTLVMLVPKVNLPDLKKLINFSIGRWQLRPAVNNFNIFMRNPVIYTFLTLGVLWVELLQNFLTDFDFFMPLTSKAFGMEGLSIDMIKSMNLYCLPAVTHLINMSLTTGVFPNSWKRSIVIPLQKCSNPTLNRHFRLKPICLFDPKCWRQLLWNSWWFT